jgi:hypothetical protein
MTISLEITEYSSGDIDEIWNWVPEDDNVYFQLTIEVAETDKPGGNYFSLVVASPEGLRLNHNGEVKDAFAKRMKNHKGLAKNGLLIIQDYSWKKLEGKLQEILKSSENDCWSDSIYELRKHFFWEYENIQYS